MEPNLSLWKTHDWISRRLEQISGAPIVLQACRQCGRDFVEERSTGDQYAAHVSIFNVHRLCDEVTSRWLCEKCPAERLTADDTDRQTRFAAGPFASSLRETANAPRLLSGGKLSAPGAQRLSGAASPKSISVSRVQLVSRTQRRDSAKEDLRAVSARLTPASTNGGPAGGG
jgi:hypothetical protein